MLQKYYLHLVRNCISKNWITCCFFVKEHIESEYTNRDKEFKNNLSIAITAKLLPEKYWGESDFSNENEIFVFNEVEKLKKNKLIIEKIIIHYNLLVLKYSFYDKDNHRKSLDKLKEITSDDPYINELTFSKYNKEIIKKYKYTRKKYINFVKDVKKAKKIYKKKEIIIPYKEIKVLLTISSVLFFSSGYIYNRLFLGYFGINVNYYFSINDYLATCLDKIFDIIFILGFSLVLGQIWWSDEYLQDRTMMSKSRLLFEDLSTYMYFLSVPLCAIVSVYLDLPYKYFSLGLFLFVVILYFAFNFSVRFKEGKNVYLMITFVALYFIYLIFPIFDDRHNILSNKKNISQKVYFTDETSGVSSDLIFLSANSNWHFLYDKSKKKSVVVSNRFIKKTTISDQPKESFIFKIINHNLIE